MNPSHGIGYASSSTDDGEAVYFGLTVTSWGKIAVVAGLFAALFWPNLRRLWQKTNPFTGEDNWRHAVCIPLIGLYYLYVHRDELIAARGQQFVWGRFVRPNRLWAGGAMAILGGVVAFVLSSQAGIVLAITSSLSTAVAVLGFMVLALDWSLGLTFFGIGLYVYGIYPGQNDYLKDVGMIISLFGVVLLMYGWGVIRVAWFPIVFLICAIPWPGLVYSWIAGPLQQLAANVAVKVLEFTGVTAMCSGTKIIMLSNGLGPPRILNVAEACAGLRSLMTFVSVGAAVSFLSNRPLWQKLIITASAVPIAIACNVFRVSGQGLLDHYWTQEISEGFAHQFVGLIMLLPAFFLILLVGVVLDKLFVEEVEEGEVAVTPPMILSRVTGPAPAIASPRAASAAAPVSPKPASPAPASPKPPAVTPPRPIGIAPTNNPRLRPQADVRPPGMPRTPPLNPTPPPQPKRTPPPEKP